jgi:hypothetical protein
MWKQLLAALVIMALAGTAAYYYWPREMPVCQICRRPMHAATSLFVSLDDGQEVELCCPRCGLRFQKGRSDVDSTQVSDYLSRRRLQAADASYVVGSSVHPCCSEAAILKDRSGIEYEKTWDRCLPSVIAFGSREDAQLFQREHGGELMTYPELQQQTDAGSD